MSARGWVHEWMCVRLVATFFLHLNRANSPGTTTWSKKKTTLAGNENAVGMCATNERKRNKEDKSRTVLYWRDTCVYTVCVLLILSFDLFFLPTLAWPALRLVHFGLFSLIFSHIKLAPTPQAILSSVPLPDEHSSSPPPPPPHPRLQPPIWKFRRLLQQWSEQLFLFVRLFVVLLLQWSKKRFSYNLPHGHDVQKIRTP